MPPLLAIPLVLALPLLGAFAEGLPLAPFLEFPPRTQRVAHAPFSWAAFALIALFAAAWVAPFVARGIRARPPPRPPPPRFPFPWWGWLGLLLALAAWGVAWTRFPWAGEFQKHTFTPLWLGYVLVANALLVRRAGACPMLARPRAFLALFPASAAFWWLFEWLNRFAQNWRYVGGERFGAGEYFLYATLPFATVLPAVLSTRDLLASFPRLTEPFAAFLPLRPRHPRALALAAALASSAALFFLGVFPNALFPALWLGPLALLLAFAALSRRPHPLSPLAAGDWRGVVTAALAALLCGFFWEMWNAFSLLKWEYSVPFVHRFLLFEMPALGWAGYLPFGLECVAVAALLDPRHASPTAHGQAPSD
jgi:hypothetical protein